MDSLKKYINAFQKLRIDRSHGIAPHKPVLLLSVFQAFQNSLIRNNRIYITPELVALFKTNWSLLVTSNHDCRFALPFFFLPAFGFAKLFVQTGAPAWKAYIPFYNTWVMQELAKRPKHWVFWQLIPVGGWFISMGIFIE